MYYFFLLFRYQSSFLSYSLKRCHEEKWKCCDYAPLRKVGEREKSLFIGKTGKIQEFLELCGIPVKHIAHTESSR